VLAWAPNVDSAVYDMTVSGDKVFLIGEFNNVNLKPRGKIAAVDTTLGVTLPWDPGIEFFGNCVTATENQLYVGGVFYTIFDEVRLGFASFRLSNGPVEAPPLDGASVKIDEKKVIEFGFQSDFSMSVIPQVSEDLLNWTDLPAALAQPGANTIHDEGSATRGTSFYRLKILP
jgi:hypothetical protein